MAKRRRGKADRGSGETVDYADEEGNVLTLRGALSAGSIRKIGQPSHAAAATQDDAWRRRWELVFERLVVSWEIAGLPLDDQKMLVGRYRMADHRTQEWVRRTIADHVRRNIPELDL